jgi:hypothetical protein
MYLNFTEEHYIIPKQDTRRIEQQKRIHCPYCNDVTFADDDKVKIHIRAVHHAAILTEVRSFIYLFI